MASIVHRLKDFMRSTLICSITLVVFLAPAGLAQEWEVGALGGAGFYRNSTITNLTGSSAQAGFNTGFAVGAFVDQNQYKYIGGEIRYLFQSGAPKLTYRGTRASMSGYTNLANWDLLIHTTPADSHLRPFVAGGLGIKIYSGTGSMTLSQPLLNFAVLKPVNEAEVLISLGGGLKYTTRKHVQFRLDFRTYMTPTPNRLFTPTLGSKIHGWLFDFVPAVGIGYAF